MRWRLSCCTSYRRNLRAEALPDFLAQAKELLRRYDADKDGKLDAEELGKIPAAKGKDLEKIIKRFDKNSDGKLDLEEIADALKALRKQ